MARAIHEWAESGIGSEVRIMYAGPGTKRSQEDEDDREHRQSGDDEAGMGEGRSDRDDDNGMDLDPASRN